MTTSEVMRRAVVLTDFADSSRFAMAGLPIPLMRHPDEVLVKVSATSVNPIEWKTYRYRRFQAAPTSVVRQVSPAVPGRWQGKV